MSSTAPIAVFVYNRPEHTRKTLEALMANTLSGESDLTIYCDGPKANAADAESDLVKRTREVVRENQWCGSVRIVEQDTNKGLAASIRKGVTDTLEAQGKAIILEDDIVTAPGFLAFMNNCLTKYSDNPKVLSVGGYLEAIDYTPKSETVFMRKGTSWGWGTWSSTWDDVCWDAAKLAREISADKRQANRFNFGGYPYVQMLKDQLDKKIDSWAILFYASCFLKNGLHAVPYRSMVRNVGMDNSGTHCKEDLFYDVQELVARIDAFPEVVQEEDTYELNYFKAFLKTQYGDSPIDFFKKLRKLIQFRYYRLSG